MPTIFEQLLIARGLADKGARELFLNPSYDAFRHDPFLLPDMQLAVERIVLSKQRGEQIYIYGDYDIDGLTATTLLLDALTALGLKVNAFIPNRFVDGYGLSKAAIKKLAGHGAQLIITVDCGSLSHAEIELANELGVDVIVTDHHSVAETMPAAIATINPKRPDHKYPFIDLAGVGVAFKLVQALQTKLDGLLPGQEKWLLDLVALGTVCDVVELRDENRANVFWGLQVMKKTRRPGIKALAAVAGIDMNQLNARSLGYVLGPRLNASGRLETAQLSLDLLTETDPMKALQIAYKLDEMNQARRTEQNRIFDEAKKQAEEFPDDPVLVLSGEGWSHGIIGIVAAKILEKYHKPTFVLEELGDESKGSARSYGDFSAVEAIRASDKWLIKGGGHKLAAGVTMKTENIPHFRKSVNDFYKAKKLQREHQVAKLDPTEDVKTPEFSGLDQKLILDLSRLEPFGNGNPQPVFCLENVVISRVQTMGSDKQHVKLHVISSDGLNMAIVGFGMADRIEVIDGDKAHIWVELNENEWRGVKSVEGRLLKIVKHLA